MILNGDPSVIWTEVFTLTTRKKNVHLNYSGTFNYPCLLPWLYGILCSKCSILIVDWKGFFSLIYYNILIIIYNIIQ